MVGVSILGLHLKYQPFEKCIIRDFTCYLSLLRALATTMDDIIVWGSTKAERDDRLREVFETTRKANLQLNKCLGMVNYFGRFVYNVSTNT